MAIKSHHLKLQSTKLARRKSWSSSSSLPEISCLEAQSADSGSSSVINCPMCTGESHPLCYQCKAFKGWTVSSRRDYVRKKFICFNCLFRIHAAKDCQMSFVCQICKQRHHTLLHPEEISKPDEIPSTSSGVNACHRTSDVSIVRGIVPTAVVNCRDGFNQLQPIRTMFDTGS